LSSEILTITLANTTQIKHHNCNRYLNTSEAISWEFELDGREHPEEYCPSITYGKLALYVTLAQVGTGLLFSMAGYSAGSAWDMLYALQFANLIPIMSYQFPSCTTIYYQQFNWTNFQEESVAVWMRHSVCLGDTPENVTSPTYNFKKMGYEYNYFIYNIADTITVLMLVSLIVPVLASVKLFLPKSIIFTNSDNFIKSRTLILIINFTFLRLAFTGFLNFSNTDPETHSSVFNQMFSIAGLAYMILVPCFYLGHAILFYREVKNLKKKLEIAQVFKNNQENQQVIFEKVKIVKHSFRYRVLFEEYNNESFLQFGYMIYFMASKVAYAYILTQMYDKPDFQLFLVCCIAISNVLWVAGF